MQRLYLFFAFTAAFSAAYQLGSMYDVDEEEAQRFMDQFAGLVEGIDAPGIFKHNMMIALPMFVPGFGVGWGLFSAWSTGFAFASIATVNPSLGGVLPLAVLYLSPFGLMELAAYSLAISRSFVLAVALARRRPFRRLLPATAAEVAAAAGLLLAAAYIEMHMIEALAGGEAVLPGLGVEGPG